MFLMRCPNQDAHPYVSSVQQLRHKGAPELACRPRDEDMFWRRWRAHGPPLKLKLTGLGFKGGSEVPDTLVVSGTSLRLFAFCVELGASDTLDLRARVSGAIERIHRLVPDTLQHLDCA